MCVLQSNTEWKCTFFLKKKIILYWETSHLDNKPIFSSQVEAIFRGAMAIKYHYLSLLLNSICGVFFLLK